jgi:hypothetical protein
VSTVSLEHRKPARLAHQAIAAGSAGRWERALQLVRRINDECGGNGVGLALMVWCETFTRHAYDGEPTGPVKLAFVQMDEDTEGAHQPPPEVVWAGQLTAAWAARDEDTYEALIATLPDDEALVGKRVVAVLRSTVYALTELPRGYLKPKPPP